MHDPLLVIAMIFHKLGRYISATNILIVKIHTLGFANYRDHTTNLFIIGVIGLYCILWIIHSLKRKHGIHEH